MKNIHSLGGFFIKVSELKNDIPVYDWLLVINTKLATEKEYLRAMQEFTEFTGKTPNELKGEAKWKTLIENTSVKIKTI